MKKALVLFTGGLDSVLSACIIKKLGFDIKLIYINNGFLQKDNSIYLNEKANEIGAELIIINDIPDYMDTVLKIAKNSEYGKGVNPCARCHAYFINVAHSYMKTHNFDFLVSGDVLQQRGNSQSAERLEFVDKLHGVSDILLRPLTANLLKDTKIVRDGHISKTDLYSITGKSRKPQLEMIKQFPNITNVQHGGGCLLTEKHYSKRWRNFIELVSYPTESQLDLLKCGRHFNVDENLIIITRNQHETELLESQTFVGFDKIDTNKPSPIMLVQSSSTKTSITIAILKSYINDIENLKFEINNEIIISDFITPEVNRTDYLI